MDVIARTVRLRRLSAPGSAPAKYETLDGHFQIEQGAHRAGSWTIVGDDCDRDFGTLRDARRYLASLPGGYDVDWSDASFPEIVRGGPMTLTEAKRRVIDHFTYLREHARAQIQRARSLRADDINDT